MTPPPSVIAQQEPAPRTQADPRPAGSARRTGRPPPTAGLVHASPSVRRLARELEVDLARVKGTGEKGRITKDDVQGRPARARGHGRRRRRPAAAWASPRSRRRTSRKFGPIETKPLARIKRLSGPHLHRSWLNVPHVTHGDEADITELEAYRKELDAAAKEKGYRVTLLAFLMKASVSALKAFPEFNSSLSPEKDSADLQEVLQCRHRRRHARGPGRARCSRTSTARASRS